MKTHPTVPTISDNFFCQDQEVKFKPMDFCFDNREISFGMVLMGPLYVPYFEDGVASDYSSKPLEIDNPEEWQQTFKAYIVVDLPTEKYHVVGEQNLHKLERDVASGYIPFDQGTGRLRMTLGLIKLADDWYGNSSTKFLEKISENLKSRT